jgi:hypothetical protein
MFGIRRAPAALLGTALLAAGGAASAADGSESARRFAPLPDPLVIRLETGDDNRASLAARDALAAALRRRGVRLTTGADATLVLRLDSEVRSNLRGPAPGGSMSDGGRGMPAYDDPASRFGAEDSGDRSTNLLSIGPGGRQENNAIIRRDRRTTQDYDRGLRYVVNASANELGTGRFVWQGHVQWDGIAADDSAGLARIAPRLAPLLGTSLAATGFDLD